MVGRKANLKTLASKLRDVGVTIVKTTEFVQGQTCRWGLAWSYVPPIKKVTSLHMVGNGGLSFMLEVPSLLYSSSLPMIFHFCI